MTLEELIEKEEKFGCKYVQTDSNHLHWFIEQDLTKWVQENKSQWGGHTIKGDKNVVVYKIFDGDKDNEFDTYLAIDNTKRQVIHNCKGYEAMAAWIDLYLMSNEHGV